MAMITADQILQQPIINSILQINLILDPKTNVDYVTNKLSRMSRQLAHAADELQDQSEDAKLDLLLSMFYKQWNFQLNDNESSTKNHLIASIIKNRQATPIGLSILLEHFATALKLPCFIIDYPEYPMLRLSIPGAPAFLIDPADGTRLSKESFQRSLYSAPSFKHFQPIHFQKANPVEFIFNWLHIIKRGCFLNNSFYNALMCSDMILELDPEFKGEHRDRGYIFKELECDHIALEEFKAQLEECPEDPRNAFIALHMLSLKPRGYLN